MSPITTPSIPATYFRGGTSKALFLHEKDIPVAGPARDALLIRLMGSPDPMQIDGMGGTHIVTSKIAIISPSEREDVDVDYTFVQIGIDEASIDYSANCGNISAGVGPFAIQEGIIPKFKKGISLEDGRIQTQEVRIFNTGTKKLLISHVAIGEDGMPLQDQGDFEIAGCPGKAAPILMDYRSVIGGSRGKGALPTSNAVDTAEVAGKQVDFTICDVANIIVHASAEDLGITGAETSAALTGNKDLIARVRELRGKAAQKVGMCQDWTKVDEEAGFLPMVALVSAPTNPDASIQARLFLDNQCHTAYAGTGSISLTACSKIAGSVVSRFVSEEKSNDQTFQIQHPSGLMPVIVETETAASEESPVPNFSTLSFVRTARRIWDGKLYVPGNVRDTLDKIPKGQSKKATSNDQKTEHQDKPTKSFAKFINNLNYESLKSETIQTLKGLVLDHIGVASAATQDAESSAPFVKAIQTLDSTNNGQGTVFANGKGFSAPYAALLNAALSHSLDFDDTMADGFLHPGTTTIAASVAEAETNPDTSITDFFAALCVGFEVTCRLGVALGAGGNQRGFHNTATAGIFGAVAAICKLRKSSQATIENALGLALSKAAGSMQYLMNGSWNKRLHPGFAAHDAFICVTLAEAGVIGAAEPFEGQYGLLNLYSKAPHPAALNAPFDPSNLWFMTTSIKPYPACRLTHPQIESTAKIAEKVQKPVSDIKRVSVKMSKEAFNIVGVATKNKLHPTNIVDAQFSSYYQTAIALLYGTSTGWKAYDHLQDHAVIDLLDKITIDTDDSFGRIETTMSIEWSDGTTTSEHLKTLRGEPGSPFTFEDIETKFVALATPIYGKEKTDAIVQTIKTLETHRVADLMKLVA